MRANIAALWCLGMKFLFSWWLFLVCNQRSGWADTGQQRNVTCLVWLGVEANLSSWSQQRTSEILQGETAEPSNLVLNLPCSRKTQARKLRALRFGFVFQVKKTPKLQRRLRWNQWILPGSHPKPPSHSGHTKAHTGSPRAHLASSFIGNVLHSFTGIQIKSRGNPLWSPRCNTSAFFYAYTQTTAKPRHWWALETLQLFKATHTVESQLKSLTWFFLELCFHLETIQPKF